MQQQVVEDDTPGRLTSTIMSTAMFSSVCFHNPEQKTVRHVRHVNCCAHGHLQIPAHRGYCRWRAHGKWSTIANFSAAVHLLAPKQREGRALVIMCTRLFSLTLTGRDEGWSRVENQQQGRHPSNYPRRGSVHASGAPRPLYLAYLSVYTPSTIVQIVCIFILDQFGKSFSDLSRDCCMKCVLSSIFAAKTCGDVPTRTSHIPPN